MPPHPIGGYGAQDPGAADATPNVILVGTEHDPIGGESEERFEQQIKKLDSRVFGGTNASGVRAPSTFVPPPPPPRGFVSAPTLPGPPGSPSGQASQNLKLGGDFHDTQRAQTVVLPPGYKTAQGLSDLSQLRSQLKMEPDAGTLARLDIGGRFFYGISAHGQPVTLSVNAISASHAESDVFQQAANAGIFGGEATLYVDRNMCKACGEKGGVRSLARQLGLTKLTVITPDGTATPWP
jgi:hypothetical protein